MLFGLVVTEKMSPGRMGLAIRTQNDLYSVLYLYEYTSLSTTGPFDRGLLYV
jgi:hypothetical protein